jgi:hypothetical protein
MTALFRTCANALLFLTLFLTASSFGQVVQVDPNDPNYCYKIEKIGPNLVLRQDIRISGIVLDQTTAPFVNSRVELRKYVSQRKQTRLQVISTDALGHFDLGIVKAGKYRLLASPSRAFKQPEELNCGVGSVCELKIKLIVNSTDQLAASCPIR